MIGGNVMKFVKGMMMGTLISAGVVFYCTEINKCAGKKMMKQGRKLMKNIGVL